MRDERHAILLGHQAPLLRLLALGGLRDRIPAEPRSDLGTGYLKIFDAVLYVGFFSAS